MAARSRPELDFATEDQIRDRLVEEEKEMTELDLLFSENFPDLADQFEAWYGSYGVKFIRRDALTSVCSRCGALVSAGGRRHHVKWHRYLTHSVWTLQGFVLARWLKSKLKKEKKPA